MGDGNDVPRSLPNPTSGEQPSGETAPAADALFDALAHRTRRHVAWYLLEESPAEVAELVTALAGRQPADADVVDAAERRRIECSLYHVHLPKLAAAGFVTYDRDAGTVSLASLPAHVEDLVRFSYEYDRATGDLQGRESRDG